jgi:hypothetical protein
MTKVIHEEVERCGLCPHQGHDYTREGKPYPCCNRKFTMAVRWPVKLDSIPEWCPLEDKEKRKRGIGIG